MLGTAEVKVLLLELLLLELLLLLDLNLLLPLELELLLASVVSVGCAAVTLRKVKGCTLFFAFSRCLCFSLFNCSLLAPTEESTNAPQPQRGFCMVPA